MFKERLRSSVILMAITLLTVILGGNVLFFTVLVISLIGSMEWYRMLKIERSSLSLMGVIASVGYYVLLFLGKEQYSIPFFIGMFFCLMTLLIRILRQRP